jgi:hypothetical protein
LKYEGKTYAEAAGPPLERMSKTCSAHAPFILHAATACHVFFSPHRIRLPRVTCVMATVRSFCIPKNSQQVNSYIFDL